MLFALPDSITDQVCVNQEKAMKTKSETVSKPKGGGTARQTRESGEPDIAPAADAIPREQLIAVAAYFRAEQRGFAPGNEMSDWLDAEADVGKMLGSGATASCIS